MANKRIDQPTGTETVGHEWDGIEELNTPLPRWWLWTFYATVVWGICYTIAYPAWPMIRQGTQGVLEWSSRGELAEEISRADQARMSVREKIAAIDTSKLLGSQDLMQHAVAGGAAAFKVNCVQCHGASGAGSEGYPNLNDDDWLWGGNLGAIEQTIRHGIRQPGDYETRISQMPAFDGAFSAAQMDGLAAHVLSLSGKAEPDALGAQVYTDNCAICHGPTGDGDRTQGAPKLNDAIWLYGSSAAEIKQQIRAPRHGMMPKWEGRLDPVTIKMLAAYVHSLGGGEDFEEVAGEAVTGDDEQL